VPERNGICLSGLNSTSFLTWTQAKDFVKFMVVVTILYLGFLTTFTLLARDTFSLSYMSWILIKVFFGSSYLGFVFFITLFQNRRSNGAIGHHG
jgi:hypothetical protein